MLNETEIIDQAGSVLQSLLSPVPFVNEIRIKQEVRLNKAKHADFIASMFVSNEQIGLVCEVKKNLQPRLVFDAIRQVKDYCSYQDAEPVYPVIVSEYISPRSAEILIDQNVSYFDLAGNCRLCFANVYIEKAGAKSKSGESRRVKSLFGLKSSRMLRLMLSEPMKAWQVKELSIRAELSFGQVSNIRRALLDQGYAVESEERGIHLTQPGALLGDWKKLYKKNVNNRKNNYYTLLNNQEKQKAIKAAMEESDLAGAGLIFNNLSAARWIAPYTKTNSESFYADKHGFEILKEHLMLDNVNSGPNVIIEEPKDSFIFQESIECAPGLRCSSEIQTCLDLYVAGEREREAADHIENHVLRNRWKNII